jgi:transposase InsO family protein
MATGDSLPLPSGWQRRVKSAVVQVVGLAHLALTHVRGKVADEYQARSKLVAENERLSTEVALLRRELDLLRARLERVPAKNRPHYLPSERLAILELKAARSWNAAEAARHLLLSAATILLWLGRLDEEGPDALVRTPSPINRFPDLVAHTVQTLKATLPLMGKQRIAQLLARAGLHVSASTVKRMLERAPVLPPDRPKPSSDVAREKPSRTVTAKYPHHVWNVDFTTIPTAAGYWAPWFPFALMLLWPFTWHVAMVVDQFSRKIVGFGVFRKEATAEELCGFLSRVVERTGRAPKYIVSDRGTQFQSEYRAWCDDNGVKPRFGAIGKHGSIALTERCIRSLKTEFLRLMLVPFRLRALTKELELYAQWFNEHRPHQGLGGKTPNEIFEGRVAARDGPKWETRRSCQRRVSNDRDRTRAALRDERGTAIELVVRRVEGRAHLPIVELRRAA